MCSYLGSGGGGVIQQETAFGGCWRLLAGKQQQVWLDGWIVKADKAEVMVRKMS